MVVAGAMGGQMAVMSSGLLELQVTWDHLPLACLIVTCLSVAMKHLSHWASLQQGKVPNLLHMTEINQRVWCIFGFEIDYRWSTTSPSLYHWPTAQYRTTKNGQQCSTITHKYTLNPSLCCVWALSACSCIPLSGPFHFCFIFWAKQVRLTSQQCQDTKVKGFLCVYMCVCFKSVPFDPEFSFLFPTIT